MFNTRLWLAQQQLRAKSARARLRAVELLRAQGDEPACRALLRAREDPDPAVRQAILEALAESQEEWAFAALLGGLRDADESVQLTAIRGLRWFRDPAAVPPLLELLESTRPAVQRAAARALEQLGWQPASPEEEVWYAIAQGEVARSARHGAVAIEPLATVMNNPAHGQRVEAAMALGEIPDPAVVPPLSTALRDADPRVRTAAANALGHAGRPEAVPSLLVSLRDPERNVRVAAAQALGRLGDLRAVDPLIAVLQDPEWEVRSAALEALGRLGDARAFQPVTERLEDADQEVRQHAAEALGTVGDKSVVDRLVLTLVDPHANVREAALRALHKLDPQWDNPERLRRLAPALQQACRTGEVGAQFAAASLIRRASTPGEGSAAPADPGRTSQCMLTRILRDLLADRDWSVRLAAAETLGRVRELDASDALETALDDPDARVAAAARAALAARQPQTRRPSRQMVAA